jgi:hypothetical protein
MRGNPSNLLWIEKLLPEPDNAVSVRWLGVVLITSKLF